MARWVLGAVAMSCFAVADARQPNILWLQTDSMDGRLFDPASPMYEKLKLTGFKAEVVAHAYTFSRHYTNSPQCVPSRTSMLTGRYVHETRTTNNGQGIVRNTATGGLDSNCINAWNLTQCEAFAASQDVTATLLDYLRDGGYALHPFGRFDVGAGVLDTWPNTTSGDGFHGGPSPGILLRGAAIPGAGKADPLNTTATADANPFADDERHTQLALNFLRDTPPPGPDDAPALVWLGVLAPHPPYDTNSSWETHVNASAVDAPPQPAQLHPYEAYQSLVKGLPVPGGTASYPVAAQQRMRGAYWGAAAQATDMLRSVIQAAGDAGWLNNTLVVITSDHGEMSLEHGQDYKNSLLEPSARVPLIVMPVGVAGMPQPGPGANGAGGVTVTAPTSHVDIVPTLLQVAGLQLPPQLRGTSLVPYLTGAVGPDQPLPGGKGYAAMEYHSNLAPGSAFGLVQLQPQQPQEAVPASSGAAPSSRLLKLITYGRTQLAAAGNDTSLPPQLFDLVSDPFELTNLAPTMPATVAAMTATLEAEFGGAGSLAAIDATQIAENVALYAAWYHAQCTPHQLMSAITSAFRGPSPAAVADAVLQWTGLDPRNATGGAPGTHCSGGGNGYD